MVRSLLVIANLCLALGFVSSLAAQDAPLAAPANGCSDCASGDCSHTQEGSLWQRAQAHCDLIHQHADLITERNDAWPKPFQCFDRQAYHMVFATMTQRGWQCECTLTGDHFDPNTQQLNRAGKSKIAGIMVNLPEITRQIHVYQDSNDDVVQARMTSVRDEVAATFPSLPQPQVLVTNNMPHGISGVLVEDVQKRFIAGLPEPKVPGAKASTISNQ